MVTSSVFEFGKKDTLYSIVLLKCIAASTLADCQSKMTIRVSVALSYIKNTIFLESKLKLAWVQRRMWLDYPQAPYLSKFLSPVGADQSLSEEMATFPLRLLIVQALPMPAVKSVTLIPNR